MCAAGRGGQAQLQGSMGQRGSSLLHQQRWPDRLQSPSGYSFQGSPAYGGDSGNSGDGDRYYDDTANTAGHYLYLLPYQCLVPMTSFWASYPAFLIRCMVSCELQQRSNYGKASVCNSVLRCFACYSTNATDSCFTGHVSSAAVVGGAPGLSYVSALCNGYCYVRTTAQRIVGPYATHHNQRRAFPSR